ncbi:MAG: hypothetical protein WKF35_03290 [Ferruginibacter sp.]
MADQKIIRERYTAMTDGELENFAREDGIGLTEEALLLLQAEFKKRQIDTAVFDEIRDGTLIRKTESIEKIENFINTETNSSILSVALNEKRDGKTDLEIFNSLVEVGMEESNAEAVILSLPKHAVRLQARANSSLLTAVFIIIAGIAFYMISPKKTNTSFAQIISICAIMYGILKFFKSLFERNKYATILKNIKSELP